MVVTDEIWQAGNGVSTEEADVAILLSNDQT